MRELVIAVIFVMVVTVPIQSAWEIFPSMVRKVIVQEQELEVDAGQSWSKRVQWPKFSERERPVLALRARVQVPNRANGCNYVLQVLLDGVPLAESGLTPRLLNKPPYFNPPNTTYHFSWFSHSQQGWMTIFSKDFEGDWGGTGSDYDFLFDVSGLVESGEPTVLSFRYLNPYIPSALKLTRAPLVIDRVTLGVMKAEDVERLVEKVRGRQEIRQLTVQPKLTPDAKHGDRAYEVVWSGRKESPTAQVAFEDLTGWELGVIGDAKVSLSASIDHILWRRQTAKLTYEGGKMDTTVILRPSKPILITQRFDAANLWVYGVIDRMRDPRPHFLALLDDADGHEVQLDLGSLTSCYWNLLHGVLRGKSARRAKFPMKFKALVIHLFKVPEQRTIYLESLAFYLQNRKPFAKMDKANRAIFPTSDEGMLPTAPPGVKVSAKATEDGAEFVSEGRDGILRFHIRPAEGCLEGVTAQWNEGPKFKPMDGGGVRLEINGVERVPQPKEVKLLSSAFRHGRLTACWRLEQSGFIVKWEATYHLRGRTLIIDVRCAGGSASGIDFGYLKGLPNPRGIEVPYLVMGGKPGPWIACADGLFVSVLPDLYHSDFSSVDSTVTPPTEDRIGLFKGTVYVPLTNGRRNDLRERILVTVSPEFSDVLPNARNPVSPNRNRLAPYMFFMGSAASQKFYATLKRYGIDYVIACDFVTLLVDDYSEGFAMRWRPHPIMTIEQVKEFRQGIKSLGYLFGFYLDATDFFPLNEWWDENKVALTPDGDLREGWYGNFVLKPNFMAQLVQKVGKKVKELYPADCVYLDTHTCFFDQAVDFEAGVEGAGMARCYILGNADAIFEARKYYGATISEGPYRWLYAGVCDMDYATLIASKPASQVPPLVDFDLLKIHPFEHGTMMGYSPTAFFGDTPTDIFKDTGGGIAPLDFYKYFAASLAYGHSLMLGYDYVPALARFIHAYALMQGIQREYLTDNVVEIRYHNGYEFVTTSRALMEDTQRLGRVRVRYSRGLTVHVNYNAEKHWVVEWDGRQYELPPFGWLIVKPKEILAYSALVGGKRVDFVSCPDYLYLNSGDARVREGAIEVEGAVWLKRKGNVWQVIPCGNLGGWKTFTPAGTTRLCRDYYIVNVPSDRGCKHIVVDVKALLGRPATDVRVTGRNEAGQELPANTKLLDDGRLMLIPDEVTVDYVIRAR